MKRERNICEVQGDKVLRGARNRVQIRERKGRRRNEERRRGRGSVIFHKLLPPQRPTRQPHFPPPAPHPLSLRVGIWSGQFSGTIAGLERSPPPDDSGAIILCGEGRIGGLLTGGSGQSRRTDSTDVTYGTPFYWLLRSVSGPASPTSSSISPRPRCRDLDRCRKDIGDASGALKGEDVSFLFLSCFRFYRLLSRSSMRGFVVMAL